ncbi:MAG TPA: DUF3016 domain-containing protein [Frateuria sp.]|uniref:DUF3016 domain-containing protein n=1 Tax=Frateuria sp. TaxID=2211372 RepID=UPI002DF1C1AC|nr:DUF3016 domain-containing protein [Frateuria sp.]
MSKLPFRSTFGLALALVTLAAAASGGTVTVRYDHPENFTETREVRAFAPSRADPGYLDTLKGYMEKQAAAVLQPGQKLDIVVTDLDRAGSYLPSAGALNPVRVVKDIYPPRMALHFRLLDSQGQVIREGERKLVDPAFMYDSPGGFANTDPLRYEKRLIDRWLGKGAAKL